MADNYNPNNGAPNNYGYQNNNYQNNGYQNNGYNNYPQYEPGKGQAIASMVLGIVGIVFWWFGYSAFVSVVLGIIGIILAAISKGAGYYGGIRTAGFVLSLICVIVGAIIFCACVIACAGIGCAAAFS